MAKIFLSCTKNTELTRALFPRTFALALNKDPPPAQFAGQQPVSNQLNPIKLVPSNPLHPPVILSEEFASRSEANPQSKDPFHS